MQTWGIRSTLQYRMQACERASEDMSKMIPRIAYSGRKQQSKSPLSRSVALSRRETSWCWSHPEVYSNGESQSLQALTFKDEPRRVGSRVSP